MIDGIIDLPASDLVSPDEAFYPRLPPLNIELSSRCNLKCPYCANPTLTRAYENMPDELFYKVVAEAKAMSGQIWSLHGVGEPLLRNDLETLMRHLDASGTWSKWIVTNGALLSLKRMHSLYAAGLRGIYNSVDTLDPDLYRRTRGGKIEKAVGNIIAAAKAYPDLPIMVGLMNHREQVVDDKVRAHFAEIYREVPNVTLHVYENGHFPGAAEDWRRELYADIKTETCSAPAAHFTIDARGFVALCCSDQNTDHVLGNVRDRTLAEIWFDRTNQNTFRRIALGLSGCPSVCHACVLKPTQRRLEEVEAVLWGPFAALVAAGEECAEKGDFIEAKRLMDYALVRDPQNPDVKRRVGELERMTGLKSDNYFQQFLDGGL